MSRPTQGPNTAPPQRIMPVPGAPDPKHSKPFKLPVRVVIAIVFLGLSPRVAVGQHLRSGAAASAAAAVGDLKPESQRIRYLPEMAQPKLPFLSYDDIEVGTKVQGDTIYICPTCKGDKIVCSASGKRRNDCSHFFGGCDPRKCTEPGCVNDGSKITRVGEIIAFDLSLYTPGKAPKTSHNGRPNCPKKTVLVDWGNYDTGLYIYKIKNQKDMRCPVCLNMCQKCRQSAPCGEIGHRFEGNLLCKQCGGVGTVDHYGYFVRRQSNKDNKVISYEPLRFVSAPAHEDLKDTKPYPSRAELIANQNLSSPNNHPDTDREMQQRMPKISKSFMKLYKELKEMRRTASGAKLSKHE